MWKVLGYDDTCIEPEDYGNYWTKKEARAAIREERNSWLKDEKDRKAFSFKDDDREGYSILFPDGYEYDIWFEKTDDGESKLISLTRDKYGNYEAKFTDGNGGYDYQSFVWYTKKEVISLLRHKYDVIVGREFC